MRTQQVHCRGSRGIGQVRARISKYWQHYTTNRVEENGEEITKRVDQKKVK